MILTKDGATHEKAEEIITKLEAAEQIDVLQVAYTLLTLALNKDDQQWLVRRFQNMYGSFQETELFQEMTKVAREQVREEERQKRLQDNRQTLVHLVQRLFPSIVLLARKQAESVTEPFVLQEMITKILSANTLEEAVQYLVEVPDTTEKHA